MATFKVQFRRGTTAEHTTFTGAQGEITYDTETNQLVLHDGVTPGGHRIPLITDVPTDLNQLTDANDVLPQLMPTTTGTWYGSRAFFACGSDTSTKRIEYINIDTLGNGTVAGNNLERRYFSTSVSDSNRIVTMGARYNYTPDTTTAEYFDIASTVTAQEFGTLSKPVDQATSTSDGLYGLVTGPSQGTYSEISYIIIQLPGDSQDFGDLSNNRWGTAAGGDQNIAIFAGGQYGSYFQNTIDTISYSTPGTATSHGQLNRATRDLGATSNDTRTVFHIGRTAHAEAYSRRVEYITTATGGTATGVAGQSQYDQAFVEMANNGTRLVSQGSYSNSVIWERVQYQDMNTLADAADFGTLTDGKTGRAAASGNP